MKQFSEIDPAQLRERIQKDLFERLHWFKSHYDIVSHHDFGPNSARIYLGDKTKCVCRYCGLAAPQATFKKLAHAIPDQIGNNWLFDYEECDNCNEHFAKKVEDDFAKWTLPWRSLGRIKGKTGIPSHKSNDKQFRIDAKKKLNENIADRNGAQYDLNIQMGIDDARHELNESTQTVKFTLERQPYVPMGAFKCLVKMAIAVMPPEEDRLCNHLKKWILLSDHTVESYPYKPLRIFYGLMPGPLPNDRISYWLLRRKLESVDDCPYMQFILQLGNHVFQIALPMHVEDRSLLEAGIFQTSLWPNTWATVENQMQYGQSGHKEFDMSSAEQIRGETMSMSLHYDHLIENSAIDAPTGTKPQID
jgi:hypothetical protein